MSLRSLEMCAGAGGQALGLEQAGFGHDGLIEIDGHACATLRLNRPSWTVFESDLHAFDGRAFKGIDLLAGGVPCPPFSVAGKQLGKSDERNLFPAALRLADETRPRAIMLENVRGILDAVFEDYRRQISGTLGKLGYATDWRLFNASDFGVPQLRPRVVFVAVRKSLSDRFEWPTASGVKARTVGETLRDLMAAGGWRGARAWAARADEIAPTVVGGSKKHGGPDLGPTRARAAWATLGVDLGDPRRRRSRYRRRTAGPRLRRDAAPDDADGCPTARLSGRLALRGEEDGGLPSSRQRLSAAGRAGGRRAYPPGPRIPGFAEARGMNDKSKTGARAKLRAHFLDNLGRVMDSAELRKIAGGINEWARRVRELRTEEGYPILTHNDRSNLKPGQYLLESARPVPAFERAISKETRALVLDRNGFTCQQCGAVAGEQHPYDSTRKTRLQIGHIVDKTMGGTDDPANLRALCSVCNEGARNLTLERRSATKLLIQIRRAAGADQLDVLKWLLKKYPTQAGTLLAKKDG